MEVLEIVLAGTANFDDLRRHSDEECRTYQSSTAVPFLQRNLLSATPRQNKIAGKSNGARVARCVTKIQSL
jgi:hypothetical protein